MSSLGIVTSLGYRCFVVSHRSNSPEHKIEDPWFSSFYQKVEYTKSDDMAE